MPDRPPAEAIASAIAGRSDRIQSEIIAGSSNGRTQDFGSCYRGSNPCPAAIHL